MKVAVFGKTLYAGVISALLAESGHDVYWCDHLAEDFNLENNFDDPVLKLIIVKQKQQGFLNDCYFEDLDLDIDAYWFCLGPHEQQQSLSIAQHLKQRPLIHPKLMINTATFGLYGTQRLQQILEDDEWVYLPDNIREGDALGSLTDAEQLIVGCDCGNSLNKLQELLRPLFPLPQQYVCMPILDAEFSKLSISGMLGSRISFINDLALVAEKIGVDIHHVRSAMAADPRIGGTYLFPGVGFGGEHFSHDILTLTRAVADAGGKSRLLEQVWEINEEQKEFMFRKLWRYFNGDLNGKIIAIWGASYKENTASVHQSPIHPMLTALWSQGAIVRLHDPAALSAIARMYGERDDLILCEQQYDAIIDAHALCVLTPWRQYWSLDYRHLVNRMQHPLLLDGRNIYRPEYVKNQGLAYIGVGRK